MTLKPILLLLAAGLVIASCETPAKQTSTEDTLLITTKCAVVYEPDSLQIEKYMKEMGEENFRMSADDHIFYVTQSTEYLGNQGIKVIDSKNNKYLNFVLSNKTNKLIKLDTLPAPWGIYLFDPAKQPYQADMSIIEQEFQNYYELK